MFTLAHSALFIKQELLADRANRKPAGDGFVYEGNDCRGFPGRPDGYSDWTCPPKRTAAGSCGPFLFGCTWRANRKPAGEASLLTKGMIARGFSGRPDGYSGWTCPPKRTD